MNRNSNRICGRKTTTDPTPLQMPSTSSDRHGESGKTVLSHCPDDATALLQAVHDRLRPGKNSLKHGDDDGRKNERSTDRMEKDRIQAAGPKRRRRRPVGSADAKIGSPLAALRQVLQYRQFDPGRRRIQASRGSEQKLLDAIDAGSFGGADQGHGRIEFRRQCRHIYFAPAGSEIVRHVEQHQGWQAEAQDRRGQHQVAAQIRHIQNEHDRVGLGEISALSGEHVVRDLLVFGAGMQAIDTGQIDQKDFLMSLELGFAHTMLDGHAREVGDFLAKSG